MQPYAPVAEASLPGGNGVLAVDDETFGEKEIRFVHPDTGHVDSFLSNGASNRHPAWSPDGRRLALVSNLEEVEGGDEATSSIYDLYTIHDDATGLEKIVDNQDLPRVPGTDNPSFGARCPSWSPDGDRIAFVNAPTFTGNLRSLMVVNVDGSGLTQLKRDFTCPVDWSPDGGSILGHDTAHQPGTTMARYDLEERRLVILEEDEVYPRGQWPRWAPDGERIVFHDLVTKRINGQNRAAPEIFVSDRDGSNVQRVTFTPHIRDEFPLRPGTSTHPEWSPNGRDIIFHRFSNDQGVYAIRPDGTGERRLPLELSQVSQIKSWRPLASGVEVRVLDGGPADGHADPVNGATVTLFREDGSPLPDEPDTAGFGTYHFPDVPPGDYRARVTLADPEPAEPVFDVRYTDDAEEASWIEIELTVVDPEELVRVEAAFTDDPEVVDTNVADRAHLDDIAAVFRNVERFVTWTTRRLNPALQDLPVEFYLFASADPDSGAQVSPDDAYYRGGDLTFVVMGTQASGYDARDGTGQAPENAEWHEFSHHLYGTNAHAGGAPCDAAATNHGGYANPDTCDSMNEGFAIFLPTVASRELDGQTTSEYANFGTFLEENRKAWESVGGSERESFAVASLLWDLFDADEDTESAAFRRDGETVFIEDLYRDRITLGLGGVWDVLTAARPPTVAALRSAFAAPPTRDLDGDETDDLALLDEAFLMHGFFPVLPDAPENADHAYDLDSAVEIGLSGEPPNEAIGRTDHEDDGSGGLVPRFGIPLIKDAHLLVETRDASGRPITGANIRISLDAPEASFVSARTVGAPGAPVYLEPRPHYGHRLSGPMPGCGTATVEVGMEVRAIVNGFESDDHAALDNCTYAHAVAAGEEPRLKFTFPEDADPPVTEAQSHTAGESSGDWSTEPWTVNLHCDDPREDEDAFASGCLRTEYRLDLGDWLTYVRPIELRAEGTHTIEYRSEDRAGNLEEPQTVTFGVDRTSPSAVLLAPPVAPGAAIRLAAVTADTSSGAAEVCFEVTPQDAAEPMDCFEASAPVDGVVLAPWTAQPTLEPGGYTVVAVASDHVGNVGRSAPADLTVLG